MISRPGYPSLSWTLEYSESHEIITYTWIVYIAIYIEILDISKLFLEDCFPLMRSKLSTSTSIEGRREEEKKRDREGRRFVSQSQTSSHTNTHTQTHAYAGDPFFFFFSFALIV